ncbi:MAG: alpha/beta hydrolase [Acidimicrobiia bacterium]
MNATAPARPTRTFRALAAMSRFMMAPAENVTPTKARKQLARASTGPTLLTARRPTLDDIRDDTIAGVPVRRYRPASARPGTIVFFHGGGWMLGSIDTHDVLAAQLAASTHHHVVSVEYRLAPEHPYPAGLDDCLAVTRAVAADGPVAVAGDSAGGGLAAVVANHLPVVAQLLIYPAVDLTGTYPSHQHYATDHLLTAATMAYFCETYVPDPARRTDPDAAPIHATTLSTAPSYLVIAQCDVLRDQGIAYAERLRTAGNVVQVDEVPGTLHGFMSLLGLREAREALTRATTWLNQQLDPPTPT